MSSSTRNCWSRISSTSWAPTRFTRSTIRPFCANHFAESNVPSVLTARLQPETWPKSATCRFPGGIYGIGHDEPGFCYDNEQPRHQVFLKDFALANRLVTNREYLDFVRDGGYSDFRHWLSDGWDAVQQTRLDCASFLA